MTVVGVNYNEIKNETELGPEMTCVTAV